MCLFLYNLIVQITLQSLCPEESVCDARNRRNRRIVYWPYPIPTPSQRQSHVCPPSLRVFSPSRAAAAVTEAASSTGGDQCGSTCLFDHAWIVSIGYMYPALQITLILILLVRFGTKYESKSGYIQPKIYLEDPPRKATTPKYPASLVATL